VKGKEIDLILHAPEKEEMEREGRKGKGKEDIWKEKR
jgi:hypothetical protein